MNEENWNKLVEESKKKFTITITPEYELAFIVAKVFYENYLTIQQAMAKKLTQDWADSLQNSEEMPFRETREWIKFGEEMATEPFRKRSLQEAISSPGPTASP